MFQFLTIQNTQLSNKIYKKKKNTCIEQSSEIFKSSEVSYIYRNKENNQNSPTVDVIKLLSTEKKSNGQGGDYRFRLMEIKGDISQRVEAATSRNKTSRKKKRPKITAIVSVSCFWSLMSFNFDVLKATVHDLKRKSSVFNCFFSFFCPSAI